MGKYMRKCRAAEAVAGTAPAVVVAGVRTRSRSAAVASEAAAAPAPKRARKTAASADVVEAGHEDGGATAGCYLQLRSRTLFMPAAKLASPRGPVAQEEALPAVSQTEAASGEAAVAGRISRCSSTASSSVDMAPALTERSSGSAEVRVDSGVDSSVSDSECVRERRETTPLSRPPPGDLSDQESSQAVDDQKQHSRRSSAYGRTAVSCRARMPPAEEIEEFFAATEKAEARRFAAKYNFDVTRGVPLDAGRFEWTPVASG